MREQAQARAHSSAAADEELALGLKGEQAENDPSVEVPPAFSEVF